MSSTILGLNLGSWILNMDMCPLIISERLVIVLIALTIPLWVIFGHVLSMCMVYYGYSTCPISAVGRNFKFVYLSLFYNDISTYQEKCCRPS